MIPVQSISFLYSLDFSLKRDISGKENGIKIGGRQFRFHFHGFQFNVNQENRIGNKECHEFIT